VEQFLLQLALAVEVIGNQTDFYHSMVLILYFLLRLLLVVAEEDPTAKVLVLMMVMLAALVAVQVVRSAQEAQAVQELQVKVTLAVAFLVPLPQQIKKLVLAAVVQALLVLMQLRLMLAQQVVTVLQAQYLVHL
jgi:hypothetical protein